MRVTISSEHKWYPSIISAFNISKEAAICTILAMIGQPHSSVEAFFSGINQPEINAVHLAHINLGLPNYIQMAEFYREYVHAA